METAKKINAAFGPGTTNQTVHFWYKRFDEGDIKLTIRPKRLGVQLLHDNTRPHCAKVTREQLEKLGWSIVTHPLYSLDITHMDYHFFRALKRHLIARRLTTMPSSKIIWVTSEI
ncbi:Histone-lysine N-methyltransferase SETMAR [Dufourea novaeangliae]|uniref:Histone-lysine N-methyltransferase SETMAR n=1 Tax=Dufourea novaeangliae TaxID=178035 RepID=A0A154P118_DUFNO|nr:Histone-lysine N-methyltransferase SETMAR [Dufourea novaeangliae]